jgi:hypothetical protein
LIYAEVLEIAISVSIKYAIVVLPLRKAQASAIIPSRSRFRAAGCELDSTRKILLKGQNFISAGNFFGPAIRVQRS